MHPRDNDLIAATHGRAIWILDDLAPLEALTPDVLKRPAALLPMRTARLNSLYTPQAWYGAGQFFAPNPPFGAIIDYYLRDAPKRPIEIDIRDAEGAVVRTFEGPARKGLNRAVWNLRLAPPLGESARAGAGGGFGGPPEGPLVLPGEYRLTVRGAGVDLHGAITVAGDSHVAFSDADRRTRQTALLNLYELEQTAGRGRDAVRQAAALLDVVRKDVADHGVSAASDRLTALERDLARELSAAGRLSRAIDGYSGVATADQQRQIDWAFDDITQTIRDLDQVLQTDLPALYAELMKTQAWPPRIPPIPPPVRRR